MAQFEELGIPSPATYYHPLKPLRGKRRGEREENKREENNSGKSKGKKEFAKEGRGRKEVKANGGIKGPEWTKEAIGMRGRKREEEARRGNSIGYGI